MNIVQVGFAYDRDLLYPDALLDRYATLTGWSEALLAAGAEHVSVVQRFHRDARFTRNGVRYVFQAQGLQRATNELEPDVIHVNGLDFPIQTWLSRKAARRRTAVVVQDHGSGDPPTRRFVRGLLSDAVRRQALHSVDGFFFTASALADPWRSHGFIRPAQRVYEVMESSTSMRAPDRDESRRASGIVGQPALLWVGRLNENKDPLTVLDGFERALPAIPGATLTMVFGEDDLLGAVNDRVRASPRLAPRVRLVGHVAHETLAVYYGAADLFVLGSHHEAYGYALLEACACGAVPVVTDIPSFRVITRDGTLGALWPVGDAASCAEAMTRVAQQDFGALRAGIVDHFERSLSWAAVGRHALSAYREAVVRRRVGRSGMVN